MNIHTFVSVSTVVRLSEQERFTLPPLPADDDLAGWRSRSVQVDYLKVESLLDGTLTSVSAEGLRYKADGTPGKARTAYVTMYPREVPEALAEAIRQSVLARVAADGQEEGQ